MACMGYINIDLYFKLNMIVVIIGIGFIGGLLAIILKENGFVGYIIGIDVS